MTLHSWAGLGLAAGPIEKLVSTLQGDPKRKKTLHRWLDAKVLIIDEVSMLAGDYFTKLDQAAQALRKDLSPFGGIQIILAGDVRRVHCNNA